MAMLGGGRIAPFGGANTVRLTSSTDKFQVTDQDNFPLFEVDASGNVKRKGGIMRI